MQVKVSGGGGSSGSTPTVLDPIARFDNSVSSVTDLPIATSTVILAARPGRKYLRVTVVAAVSIFCSIDEPAVVNQGAKITSQTNMPASWEPYPVPTGEIRAINALAGGKATVLEGF